MGGFTHPKAVKAFSKLLNQPKAAKPARAPTSSVKTNVNPGKPSLKPKSSVTRAKR